MEAAQAGSLLWCPPFFAVSPCRRTGLLILSRPIIKYRYKSSGENATDYKRSHTFGIQIVALSLTTEFAVSVAS